MNIQAPNPPGSNLTSQSMNLQAPTGFERIASTAGFSGMPGFGGHVFSTGFERLSSVPYTPGITDKLGANDQFSRLASLGNFAAAQNNAFARVSSSVSNIPTDAFTRATSSFIPFPNPGFDRVSSLTGATVPQLQHPDHNSALDAQGKNTGPISNIPGGTSTGFTRAPSMGQMTRTPSMGQSMHPLPFGLFQGQQGALVGAQGKGADGMGHMGHLNMTQTPAARDMGMAWQRTMSGANDVFARTASMAGGFPSMMGQEGAPQGLVGHWDASALGGAGNLPMDVWGGMGGMQHGGMQHAMAQHSMAQHGMAHHSMAQHPAMHNFGFSHEHMALMPPAMYAAHGLQHGLQMPTPMVAPGMTSARPPAPPETSQDNSGKKGRGKNKAGKSRNDPEAGARKKRRTEKREGGGEGDDDGQGFEKHNQFLWAKRMGQQNEPRWGLFKQGGSAGPAFLKLLEQLEEDGILERQYGVVPETLGGVSGWIVKDGMMQAWQRRRQAWFMEGKEGKEYKPNSLYQIMRRLGFFPTMRSSRAGHGHDFEGSTVFRWDSDRKYSQRRLTKGAADDANDDDNKNKIVPNSAVKAMALHSKPMVNGIEQHDSLHGQLALQQHALHGLQHHSLEQQQQSLQQQQHSLQQHSLQQHSLQQHSLQNHGLQHPHAHLQNQLQVFPGPPPGGVRKLP